MGEERKVLGLAAFVGITTFVICVAHHHIPFFPAFMFSATGVLVTLLVAPVV